MQNIIKIESRIEKTKSGKTITVYRRVVIKPTDSNYPEELQNKQEYLANKNTQQISYLC